MESIRLLSVEVVAENEMMKIMFEKGEAEDSDE